jgi:hypothetical protein
MDFGPIKAVANNKQLRFEFRPFFSFNHFWGEMRFPDAAGVHFDIQTFGIIFWPRLSYMSLTGQMQVVAMFLCFMLRIYITGRGKRSNDAINKLSDEIIGGKKTAGEAANEMVDRAKKDVSPPEL